MLTPPLNSPCTFLIVDAKSGKSLALQKLNIPPRQRQLCVFQQQIYLVDCASKKDEPRYGYVFNLEGKAQTQHSVTYLLTLT